MLSPRAQIRDRSSPFDCRRPSGTPACVWACRRRARLDAPAQAPRCRPHFGASAPRRSSARWRIGSSCRATEETRRNRTRQGKLAQPGCSRSSSTVLCRGGGTMRASCYESRHAMRAGLFFNPADSLRRLQRRAILPRSTFDSQHRAGFELVPKPLAGRFGVVEPVVDPLPRPDAGCTC